MIELELRFGGRPPAVLASAIQDRIQEAIPGI
jgi:hypothetical protein